MPPPRNGIPIQSVPATRLIGRAEAPEMLVKRNTVLIFRATSASLDFVADPYEVPFQEPPQSLRDDPSMYDPRYYPGPPRAPWAPVYCVHGVRLSFFNGDDDNRVIMNYRTPGSEVLGAKVFDVAFAAAANFIPITTVWVWRPGEPWAIRALRPTNAELFVYAERTDRVD